MKLGYLRLVAADQDRKPFVQIAAELAKCTWRTRRFPAHYFSSFIYRQNSGDWQSYLDRRTMDKVWSSQRLHHPLGTNILKNKLFFDLFYRDKGVTLPRTLGYYCNGHVFVGNDRLPLAELSCAMEKLLNSSNSKSIFVKPLDGINGRRCRRFGWHNLNSTDIQTLTNELVNESFLFQETLTQHHMLSAIYPHAINTLRMDTMVQDDGSVAIISALMRFGMHGREVDNGGCFIGVDLESGVLDTHALCFIHLGGGVYDAHPNTLHKFAGFTIPFFTEAKQLVVRAAHELPSRLVGWDVAITPLQPVLIEGNHNYHLGMADTVSHGYRNNPRFCEVLRLT